MRPPDHVRILSPKTLPPPAGYSHIAAVSGGQMIYLAGQVALDASGALVGPGDFHAQTRQIFENIKIALNEVGADFSHVVKLTYYLIDRSNAPIVREVRDQYVNTEAPPVSTLVEVRGLARDDFLLEIEATACLPG